MRKIIDLLDDAFRLMGDNRTIIEIREPLKVPNVFLEREHRPRTYPKLTHLKHQGRIKRGRRR